MTYIVRIEGTLRNDFPLEHKFESPSQEEAWEDANAYVDGMGDMLKPNSVEIFVDPKPRFENQMFNDVADLLYERLSEGEVEGPLDQEAVDEAIRLHGEQSLWDYVSGLIDGVDSAIAGSGALARAVEMGVKEGRLTN